MAVDLDALERVRLMVGVNGWPASAEKIRAAIAELRELRAAGERDREMAKLILSDSHFFGSSIELYSTGGGHVKTWLKSIVSPPAEPASHPANPEDTSP